MIIEDFAQKTKLLAKDGTIWGDAAAKALEHLVEALGEHEVHTIDVLQLISRLEGVINLEGESDGHSTLSD